MYQDKELIKVGSLEDGDSSKDSELDSPSEFKELLETRRIIRQKPNSTFKSKMIDTSSNPSATKLVSKILPRELSPRKLCLPQDMFQPFLSKINQTTVIAKKISAVQ